MDVVLGPSTDPHLFEFQACHKHSHFGGFVEATLLDQAGQVAASVKQGFCLLGTAQFDPTGNPFSTYDRNNQSLSAGWADVYTLTLDCRWLDITGSPRRHLHPATQPEPEPVDRTRGPERLRE